MAELSGIQQKKLIEFVQQHHPHMGETEIRELLNTAQREIVEATEILKSWFTTTTVADQRFYTLDAEVLKIKRVELTDADGNYYQIPRLLGKPELGDTT